MAAGTGYSDDKYDVYRQELWTPRITKFMEEKLVGARIFQDYSAEVINADTVHIPHISDTFAATDIPVTNGAVTATDISETKTDLTIDNWKGASFYITRFEEREIMKRPNIVSAYQQGIGYKLGKSLESAILANLGSLTASVGVTTGGILSTQIEEACGILSSNSVPKEECVFFINPKVYWGDIMSIAKYSNASQYGKPSVPMGYHDYLYGVPVLLTPNVPVNSALGLDNAIAHRDSIVFAKAPVNFTVGKSENLRKKIIGDIMYGDNMLQASWGVRLLSTSL